MNTFRIHQATERDLGIVIGLIDDAARWLGEKGIDQWQRPWPSRDDRDNRLMYDLKSGKTWILRFGDTPAATITTADTLSPYLPPLWPSEHEPSSVYAHRLVVARGYSGRGIGAALLNWAGNEASEDYGAKWIRIDVWRTNLALHRYYTLLGFRFVGLYGDDTYPSSALFERPIKKNADTSAIEPLTVPCLQGARGAAR